MDFSSHLQHFEELRKRLIVCLVTFFVLSVVAYFFSHPLLDLLTWPLRLYSSEPLVFQKPYEAFLIHIKVAAFAGLVLASPLLLTQLWLFIAPGLYDKEKKVFLPVLFISIALFLVGIVFAFLWVIPWGLHLMLSFQTDSMKPMLSIGPYFSFLTGMLLAFGVLFDFPVILVGLVELGVVRTATLVQSRRSIIVVIFIAAAVLTPSPDPLSQLLLAFPLWALFEISIFIARRREKAKNLPQNWAKP